MGDLLHSIQDIRLPVIVPVCTNSKVDLAGVFVSLESLRNTWSTRIKKDGEMLRQQKFRVPRMGSGGPAGTFAHVERAALARFLEGPVRGREMACIVNLLGFKGFLWRVVVRERKL